MGVAATGAGVADGAAEEEGGWPLVAAGAALPVDWSPFLYCDIK
jgi:hypothetical protein